MQPALQVGDANQSLLLQPATTPTSSEAVVVTTPVEQINKQHISPTLRKEKYGETVKSPTAPDAPKRDKLCRAGGSRNGNNDSYARHIFDLAPKLRSAESNELLDHSSENDADDEHEKVEDGAVGMEVTESAGGLNNNNLDDGLFSSMESGIMDLDSPIEVDNNGDKKDTNGNHDKGLREGGATANANINIARTTSPTATDELQQTSIIENDNNTSFVMIGQEDSVLGLEQPFSHTNNVITMNSNVLHLAGLKGLDAFDLDSSRNDSVINMQVEPSLVVDSVENNRINMTSSMDLEPTTNTAATRPKTGEVVEQKNNRGAGGSLSLSPPPNPRGVLPPPPRRSGGTTAGNKVTSDGKNYNQDLDKSLEIDQGNSRSNSPVLGVEGPTSSTTNVDINTDKNNSTSGNTIPVSSCGAGAGSTSTSSQQQLHQARLDAMQTSPGTTSTAAVHPAAPSKVNHSSPLTGVHRQTWKKDDYENVDKSGAAGYKKGSTSMGHIMGPPMMMSHNKSSGSSKFHKGGGKGKFFSSKSKEKDFYSNSPYNSSSWNYNYGTSPNTGKLNYDYPSNSFEQQPGSGSFDFSMAGGLASSSSSYQHFYNGQHTTAQHYAGGGAISSTNSPALGHPQVGAVPSTMSMRVNVSTPMFGTTGEDDDLTYFLDQLGGAGVPGTSSTPTPSLVAAVNNSVFAQNSPLFADDLTGFYGGGAAGAAAQHAGSFNTTGGLNKSEANYWNKFDHAAPASDDRPLGMNTNNNASSSTGLQIPIPTTDVSMMSVEDLLNSSSHSLSPEKNLNNLSGEDLQQQLGLLDSHWGGQPEQKLHLHKAAGGITKTPSNGRTAPASSSAPPADYNFLQQMLLFNNEATHDPVPKVVVPPRSASLAVETENLEQTNNSKWWEQILGAEDTTTTDSSKIATALSSCAGPSVAEAAAAAEALLTAATSAKSNTVAAAIEQAQNIQTVKPPPTTTSTKDESVAVLQEFLTQIQDEDKIKKIKEQQTPKALTPFQRNKQLNAQPFLLLQKKEYEETASEMEKPVPVPVPAAGSKPPTGDSTSSSGTTSSSGDTAINTTPSGLALDKKARALQRQNPVFLSSKYLAPVSTSNGKSGACGGSDEDTAKMKIMDDRIPVDELVSLKRTNSMANGSSSLAECPTSGSRLEVGDTNTTTLLLLLPGTSTSNKGTNRSNNSEQEDDNNKKSTGAENEKVPSSASSSAAGSVLSAAAGSITGRNKNNPSREEKVANKAKNRGVLGPPTKVQRLGSPAKNFNPFG
ncbi:unnamed protein product [Amoebophrya sp. A120]|nr:unnamed protein product [Amoebophrya sp. A120]|eukprot:GSA120T00016007001.1